MNRRGFLRGMFAAVAIAVAKPLNISTELEPLEVEDWIQWGPETNIYTIRTGLPMPTWRLLHQGVPVKRFEDGPPQVEA